jgi:LAS superfamily LD-carboxypeptidase LdcB
VVVALVALAALWAPEVSDAAPVQEPGLEEQQQDIEARRGEVALEIDAMRADNAEIEAALAVLDANVASQQAALDTATAAATEAQAALTEAETAVAEAEAQVRALNEASDALMVQSFVSPPAESAWDTLSADSMSDAAVMRAILDMQADQDASVLDLLEAARDRLSSERDQREDAAAAAEEARAAAEGALSRVRAARDQQAMFAAEAEAALNRRLVEAENLATLDAELSRQIAEEAAEQARIQEQAAASGTLPATTTTVGDVTLATVSCHDGGAITVAASLAPSLQQLLDHAFADGLVLCGGGYRSPDEQIQLRMEHCGTSYYAIYEMPSSQCDPPTAPPGSSQHELGLAVDFVNCSSQSTACFQWLNAHASAYGLYNFPPEPWHWSTTGE